MNNTFVNSFDEMMAIIKRDKKGDELVIQMKPSTRNDVVFNLITEEDWKLSDNIKTNSNRWYLFENKNITISINDGNDDFYEDVVINFNNPIL